MAVEPSALPDDEALRVALESTVRQAFFAAQLAPPSSDPDAAVQSLWITLESLMVDHLAPPRGDERDREPVPVATWWRRLLTTGVTHAFVLGGTFVTRDEVVEAAWATAGRSAAGRLWHTRRPPGQGALVLEVHAALLRLDATIAGGDTPDADDGAALVDLVALATVGAVLADSAKAGPDDPDEGPVGSRRPRWASDPARVAAAFGIPDVNLVAVTRDEWVCDECGCAFAGRVESGIAYPDRMAPVGRQGPCDSSTACACHAAPLQRRVR
jgi:hypothetical protein